MKSRTILAALALFASPITAAPVGSAKLSNDANTLDDTSWSLSALSSQSLLPDSQVTIHFENGRVHGTDGCNRYDASYTAVDGGFKVGEDIATTRMGCPEPVMRQAAAFMGVLSAARGYRRDVQRLALLSADGKELAVFAAQSRTLGETSWLVTGYNNGKQAVVSVLAGSELTAVFNSDGALSGSAGCNTYTATYETSGNHIKIEPVVATFKMCADPAGMMEQEAQYLKALATAATYRLDGSQLELRTADGALATTLKKGTDLFSPSPLHKK
jgi:heat shock protein HslJ